jgi:hypothetical protein
MQTVAEGHMHCKLKRGLSAYAPGSLWHMAKTKNRVIRSPERTWDAFGQVVAAEGTTRAADLNAYMEKRINAFIRKGGVINAPAGNQATHDDTPDDDT